MVAQHDPIANEFAAMLSIGFAEAYHEGVLYPCPAGYLIRPLLSDFRNREPYLTQ